MFIAIEFKDIHNEFTVEEQAVIVNLNTFEIAEFEERGCRV